MSPVGFIGGAERVLLECIRQVRLKRPDWLVTVLLLDSGPLEQAVVELGATARTIAMPSFLSKRGDSRLIANHNSDRSASFSASARSVLSKGFEVLRLPMKAASAAGYLLRIRKAIRDVGPDLIHSNGLKSHLITALTQPTSSRVLWHIHDFYSHRPKVQAWIRRASRQAIGSIAISQAVADDIAKVVPTKPVHLLENCVDTDYFTPGRSATERMDQLAAFKPEFDGLRIGIVATYANWKGQDVFIKAVAQVPNVRGYVIGGPIYSTGGSQWSEPELRNLARLVGVEDRIGFIPFQSDPTWLYRSLDIVVHASIRPEPFGLTIIEAMACGRPVIVSDAGGAHDLFTEGVTGIGHVPRDVSSLAQALQRLVGDAELRENLGNAARQSATSRFSSERFGETLIRIYESVTLT